MLKEATRHYKQSFDSAGRLRHPIRVAAFYGISFEYQSGQWTAFNKVEFTYIGWFEKRHGSVILLVAASRDEFWINEGTAIGLVRILVLPLVVFALSIIWFWKTPARE